MEAPPGLPRDVAAALELAFPVARPGEAKLLGSGWNADAWRVAAEGGDLVVRVPRREWARGEIERQTCLAPKLARHGVPVPGGWALLLDGTGRTLAGVYRYVDGEPAPARTHARRRLVGRIARLLEGIHTFPVTEALDCGATLVDPWEDRWRPIVERHAGGLGPRTRAWVEQRATRLQELLQDAGGPVLVHGDLQPEHLLLDASGDVTAVLDFSGPMVTDRAVDFGRLAQFWHPHLAAAVRVAYRLPTGGSVRARLAFGERMFLYAELEPLRTIAVEAEMGTNVWTGWARRKLAARARRRPTPATPPR